MNKLLPTKNRAVGFVKLLKKIAVHISILILFCQSAFSHNSKEHLEDDSFMSYCAASAINFGDDFIRLVDINTIFSFTSNVPAYHDLTSLSTDVELGSSHEISITVEDLTSTNQVIVWIDYNQDNDFDDPGEEVFSETGGDAIKSGIVVIPCTAMVGMTRMRVRSHDTAVDPNSTPCGNAGTGQVEDYSINIIGYGSPVPGNTLVDLTPPVCADMDGFSLSYENSLTEVSTHQWQSSPDNVTWTNISGATESTLDVSSISNATWYRCEVSNCAGTAFSTPIEITVETCYCEASSSNTVYEWIFFVEFNSISNANGSSFGYQDFTAISTDVELGSTYFFSTNIQDNYSSNEVIVWIDYNQDKDFDDPGEEVFSATGIGPNHSGNITIPCSAMLGNTRMRVRSHDTSTGPNDTPCGTSGLGQVEDYTINIVAGPATPVPGNTLADVAPPVCVGTEGFILSLENSLAASTNYQWQVSLDNVNWEDISMANSSTHEVANIGSAKWYRCQVSNCSGTTFSTSIQMTVEPCYCEASSSNTFYEWIKRVTFNTIDNVTSNSSGSAPGYEDFTSISTTIEKGYIYDISIKINDNYSSNQVIVWIDFNQDFDYDDPGEEVFSASGIGPFHTGTITIPTSAFTGATTMRVRSHDTGANSNYTSCGPSGLGQVEDYSINIEPISSPVRTWTGGTGDWDVSTNWLPIVVPTSSNEVAISSGTVSIPTGVAANALNVAISDGASLTIASGATLTLNGSTTTPLSISSSGTQLNNDGNIDILSNATGNGISNTDGASVINTGNIVVATSATINGHGIFNDGMGTSFQNNGGDVDIRKSGTGAHAFTNSNGAVAITTGDLKIGKGASSEIGGDGINNSSGASFTNSGSIKIPKAGTMEGMGLHNDGASTTFNNSGSMEIEESGLNEPGILNSNGATFTNTNVLEIGTNGGNIGSTGIELGSDVNNAGTIIMENIGDALIDGTAGIFNLQANGTVQGEGSIASERFAINGGAIAPGNSPGIQTFNGDEDFSLSIMEIEIDGISTPGSDHDQVVVNGTATLGGTIEFLINYTPTNGDQVVILDASSINGTFSGITGASGWFLNYDLPNPGEVSLSFGAPLPVELIDFSAKEINQKVHLNWQTASETDNHGFEIERSADGKSWESIGFIKGAGNTVVEKHYHFIDRQPIYPKSYFRSRQIDFNGDYSFSETISVKMKDLSLGFNVFPNPVVNELQVDLPGHLETYELQILSMGGRVLKQIPEVNNGFHKIEVEDLPSGTYLIQATSGQVRLLKRWVKR